jgi:hypothetical protein
MEAHELVAIRSGHAKVQKRERRKMSVRQSQQDEYPLLGRAPQKQQELIGTTRAVIPAASGLAAPSVSDEHYDMRVNIIKGNLCMLSNTRAHDTHHK